MKIFLGGTCNNSNWRDTLKPMLTANNIDFFDPVVDDWNEEAQEREIKERKTADIVLYTLTPKMKGCYSVAEVVDDSNKRPEKTILIILQHDDDKYWLTHQIKSMEMVEKMVSENGAHTFKSFKSLIEFLIDK